MACCFNPLWRLAALDGDVIWTSGCTQNQWAYFDSAGYLRTVCKPNRFNRKFRMKVRNADGLVIQSTYDFATEHVGFESTDGSYVTPVWVNQGNGQFFIQDYYAGNIRRYSSAGSSMNTLSFNFGTQLRIAALDPVTGAIYNGTGTFVIARNPSTGAIAWFANTPSIPGVGGNVTHLSTSRISGGVYALRSAPPNDNAAVYKYDSAGNLQWSQSLNLKGSFDSPQHDPADTIVMAASSTTAYIFFQSTRGVNFDEPHWYVASVSNGSSSIEMIDYPAGPVVSGFITANQIDASESHVVTSANFTDLDPLVANGGSVITHQAFGGSINWQRLTVPLSFDGALYSTRQWSTSIDSGDTNSVSALTDITVDEATGDVVLACLLKGDEIWA